MWGEFESKDFARDAKANTSFAQALLDYCKGEYEAGRWSLLLLLIGIILVG